MFKLSTLCVFEPPFGRLRDNVRCFSWAHRKARSGLPIRINWTFFFRRHGWDATGENRSKIGVLKACVSVCANFSRRGRRPRPIILHEKLCQWMPNLVADSFHTKKLCSRLSSSEVRFYTKNGRFVFLSHLWGLRGNVRCSSYCKARSGLSISVNWPFLLGVTAEALQANIDWNSTISLQRGPVDSKFQVEGVAPTNHSSSQKTNLNDLFFGIKISTDLSSVLSQCTRLTDRQTGGRTDTFLVASPRWHSMQRGKK